LGANSLLNTPINAELIFYALFYPHVFLKNTNNVTRTTLPNGLFVVGQVGSRASLLRLIKHLDLRV